MYGRATRAFDSIKDGYNGADCNGHGTHVAGIAASVSRYATFHSIRILNCNGSGSLSGVLEGIDYVIKQHKARGSGSGSGGSITDKVHTQIRTHTHPHIHTYTLQIEKESEDAS